MKIGIIGTGGVGGYFGARLASAGNEVHFIARGAHLNAIKKNGLILKSVKGDLKIASPKASDKLSDLADCELIILGTKAYHVKGVAKALAESLNKNALILPLQNGVLAIEELTAYFDKKQILGGLCVIFSHIESPGIINHIGLDPVITFGEIDHTIKERTLNLQTVFKQADIENKVTDDIEAALWKKFMLICLGGFGTISDAGFGIIRKTPETRQLLIDSLTEVSIIAKAKNIKLETDIVEKSMTFIDSFPEDARSSLSRDVLNGKPSEIEYHNGTVVRFGKELGIETPVNNFIYSFVKLIAHRIKNTQIYKS